MSTNNSVNTTLSGQTGTGNFVGATSPTLVTPVLGAASATSIKLTGGTNQVLDTNGNAVVDIIPASSAVNFISMANSATGVSPTIAAGGSDTNISLVLAGKGNSGCTILGASTASNAPAGYVGEFISSTVSSVGLSSGVTANLTSISLTAGDWDVSANFQSNVAASTVPLSFICGISNISATFQTFSEAYPSVSCSATFAASTGCSLAVGTGRINISTTTTIYLVILSIFTTSTLSANGMISARRVR